MEMKSKMVTQILDSFNNNLNLKLLEVMELRII